MSNIRSYRELRVYQSAFAMAMHVFELTKSFPVEERYSLTDQLRRASRSVCANLAEAWRRRRSAAHFVSKLNDAETEAEESRVWIQFATSCRYLDSATAAKMDEEYGRILGQIVSMINSPDDWCIKGD